MLFESNQCVNDLSCIQFDTIQNILETDSDVTRNFKLGRYKMFVVLQKKWWPSRKTSFSKKWGTSYVLHLILSQACFESCPIECMRNHWRTDSSRTTLSIIWRALLSLFHLKTETKLLPDLLKSYTKVISILLIRIQFFQNYQDLETLQYRQKRLFLSFEGRSSSFWVWYEHGWWRVRT